MTYLPDIVNEEILDADLDSIVALIRAGKAIIPVSGATQRDQIGAELNPSPQAPVYYDRADTGNVERDAGSGPIPLEPVHGTRRPWTSAAFSGQLPNGTKDLNLALGTPSDAGGWSAWETYGVQHARKGLWWWQASILTNGVGARWGTIQVYTYGPGTVSLSSSTADDTSQAGFGLMSASGFMYCPAGFALRLRSVTNAIVDIRGGSSFRAVWIGY